MTENELSKIIVNTAYQIHYTLGPGLLESVYEEIMYYELCKLGLNVEKQKGIPVIWNKLKMEIGFRADLIIESKVIIELKSVEAIAPVHPKQLLTYLKLTGLKLGLLINFNEPLIKKRNNQNRKQFINLCVSASLRETKSTRVVTAIQ